MTRDEAEDFIGTYRVNVRRWSFAMSGLADCDADELLHWIEDGRGKLVQIGNEFPDLAPTAYSLGGLREQRYPHTPSTH